MAEYTPELEGAVRRALERTLPPMMLVPASGFDEFVPRLTATLAPLLPAAAQAGARDDDAPMPEDVLLQVREAVMGAGYATTRESEVLNAAARATWYHAVARRPAAVDGARDGRQCRICGYAEPGAGDGVRDDRPAAARAVLAYARQRDEALLAARDREPWRDQADQHRLEFAAGEVRAIADRLAAALNGGSGHEHDADCTQCCTYTHGGPVGHVDPCQRLRDEHVGFDHDFVPHPDAPADGCSGHGEAAVNGGTATVLLDLLRRVDTALATPYAKRVEDGGLLRAELERVQIRAELRAAVPPLAEDGA